MPEKDGDEGKSTKSVVNKKQKQLMGEEGYDIARDMGRVRPSKDKKDATTMPPSKEMEKTRKVNKGPSALDIVKKKYKGQIMKVEELDLTQVAEALGGYIVEAPVSKPKGGGATSGGGNQNRNQNQKPKKAVKTPRGISDIDQKLTPQQSAELGSVIGKKDVKLDYPQIGTRFDEPAVIPGREKLEPLTTGGPVKRTVDPNLIDPKFRKNQTPNVGGETPTLKRQAAADFKRKVDQTVIDPEMQDDLKRLIKRGRPVGVKDKTKRYVAKNPSKKDEVLAAMTPGQRERNLRQVKREIDAKNPTIQTQTGPVPYRNRRVATTSALVPQYDRTPKIMKPDTKVLNKLSPNVKTSFFQPTVGALPLTQTDFNKIVPFRRPTKTYNDIINPEIVDPGGRKPEKGEPIGKDTGRTVTTTATEIKPEALKPPKIHGYLAPPEQKKKTTSGEPETETDKGGAGGGKRVNKVGTATPGKGPFSRIRAFARRNPALSLIGYDALKNLRAPRVEKPTKTGRVSAGT